MNSWLIQIVYARETVNERDDKKELFAPFCIIFVAGNQE